MGCSYSRIDREETVSRCKARRRYMKQLVKARQALAALHSMYLRFLRGTGAALLQFSNNETTLHRHHHHVPPPYQPPPPPMSPSSDTWTSATTASPALPSPPPPPPSSSWDFWDPFAQATASRSATEEEWEEGTASASEVAATATATTTASGAASMAAPPSVMSGFSKDTESSELAMVVSRNSKELVEIVKEVDEYFLKAAEAGRQLSVLLELSNSNFPAQTKGGKVYNYGCNLTTPTTWT